MRFDKYTKVLFRATVKEAFAISPIANGLLGLLGVWGSYAILKSGVLGPELEITSWITSSAFLVVMQVISILAVLLMSVKSLVPAVSIWVAGVALIFVAPSMAPWALIGAAVSGMMFRSFSYR
ncbi:hypothetical protein LPN04_29935 [Rugamonas sp. A1-17]|nr:hypothetical protein [Rugamonas sp. A1-17]